MNKPESSNAGDRNSSATLLAFNTDPTNHSIMHGDRHRGFQEKCDRIFLLASLKISTILTGNMISPVCAMVQVIGLLLVILLSVRAQEEPVKLIDVTPEMQSDAAKALEGCPLKTTRLNAGLNKNGVYTLTGDVFNNGRMCAVLDHNPILIAEWKHQRWVVKAAINTAPAWKSPGWDKETSTEWEPMATKPFSLLTLQGQTLLVIAGTEEKYNQNYVALRLEPRGPRIVDAISSYGQWPVVTHGYLVTADASRRKADWGGTYFSQIRHNEIVLLKSWEDFIPINQQDSSEFDGYAFVYHARSGKNSYTIMPDYSKHSHPADLVVFKEELHLDGWRGIVHAWKSHKIWAKLYFTPKNKNVDSDFVEKEIVYVFSKLTGLPRDCYRITSEYRARGRAEEEASVKVKGNRDAVALLLP